MGMVSLWSIWVDVKSRVNVVLGIHAMGRVGRKVDGHFAVAILVQSGRRRRRIEDVCQVPAAEVGRRARRWRVHREIFNHRSGILPIGQRLCDSVTVP
jgi:hypothetical protein